MVDTSDEWIAQRTGIRERRIAADGETTSDMGLQAARAALAAAGRRCPVDRSDRARHLDARQHLSGERGRRAGRARHHPRRRLRSAGGVLGLRLRPGDRRRSVEDRRPQARAGDRRRRPSRASSIGPTAPPACCSATAPARWCWRRKSQPGTRQDRGILTTHLRSDGRHKYKLYVDGGPSSTKTVGHLRMEGREVFKHRGRR